MLLPPHQPHNDASHGEIGSKEPGCATRPNPNITDNESNCAYAKDRNDLNTSHFIGMDDIVGEAVIVDDVQDVDSPVEILSSDLKSPETFIQDKFVFNQSNKLIERHSFAIGNHVKVATNALTSQVLLFKRQRFSPRASHCENEDIC